jgi:hypothetical protein
MVVADTIGKAKEFVRRREALKKDLAGIGDMRPGSLVGRYRKCGKPNCHCAGAGSVGHGPSWSLTREVEGKTVTKIISPGAAVEQTRAQIAEYRRFRALTRELVEVSEKRCDAQLASGEAATEEGAAKKGGSKKPSRRKSAPRSRRS